MTDPPTSDVSLAFDRARAWDLQARDERIDQNLIQLDRLAQTISTRPTPGVAAEPSCPPH